MKKTLISKKTNVVYAVAIVLAATLLGSQSTVNAVSAKLAVSNTSNDAQALAAKTTKELDRRIAEVKSSGAAIDSSDNVPAATKTKLKQENTDMLSSLESLKAVTSSATSLADAKKNAATTDGKYKEFQVTSAKGDLLKDIDSQKDAQTQLTKLTDEAKTKVSDAKSEGKETGNLEEQIKQITDLIKFVATIITSVIALITALAAGDFTAALTILTSIMDQLGITQNILKGAQSSVKIVIGSIGGTSGGSSSLGQSS